MELNSSDVAAFLLTHLIVFQTRFLLVCALFRCYVKLALSRGAQGKHQR